MNDGTILAPDVLKRFLREFSSEGLAVKVAGREPTLYPHLDIFIKGCMENGIRSCIITGGAQISQWADILKCGCDHLRISVNALHAATHDAIHRPFDSSDSFKERVSNIHEIIAERKLRGLTTGITYLDRKENKGELKGFLEEWKLADYIRLASLDYIYEHKISNDMEYAKQVGGNVRIHSEFQEADIDAKIVCPALLSRVVIAANGDVLSCHKAYQLREKGVPAVYGNLYNESFSKIWESQNRRETIKMIEEINRKQFLECGTYECGACNNCKYKNFNQINRWIISNM